VFGRNKPSQTHTQQLLDELAESYGHLRLAAGHAAGGAAEKVTPGYDKARNTAARGWSSTKGAFSPLYEQMREGATNARKEAEVANSKNRWPMLMGLLAAGAAVGAAGALVAKRRRAAQHWDEFEPGAALDDSAYDLDEARDEAGRVTDSTKDKTGPATGKVAAGAAAVAETVSTQAGKVAESLHGKSDSAAKVGDKAKGAADKTGDAASKAADKTGDAAGQAADKVSDATSKAGDKASDVASSAKESAGQLGDDAAARANASKGSRP